MESRAYLAGATLQPKAHSFCRSFTIRLSLKLVSIFQGKLGWFFFKVNFLWSHFYTCMKQYKAVRVYTRFTVGKSRLYTIVVRRNFGKFRKHKNILHVYQGNQFQWSCIMDVLLQFALYSYNVHGLHLHYLYLNEINCRIKDKVYEISPRTLRC